MRAVARRHRRRTRLRPRDSGAAGPPRPHVLATDVDAGAAAEAAEEVGGSSMDAGRARPRGARAAARAAAERGPLEVWVNNAGVMRAGQAWEHSDDDVRLTATSTCSA